MFPPIFAVCAAHTPLTALIGTDPVRLYPAMDAPQDETKPYVVWQIIGGAPENYLAGRPDMDRYALQIDAYATTLTAARNLGQVLRDVIEPLAYITGFRGEYKEPETNLYRISFDVEWYEEASAASS